MDLMINDNDFDVKVEGNDLQMVEQKDATVQLLRQTFATFLGEWFLNTEIGIDYFGKILIKNPDAIVVDSILRNTILDVKGILNLTRYTVEVDTALRAYYLDFTADTVDGEINFNEEVGQ